MSAAMLLQLSLHSHTMSADSIISQLSTCPSKSTPPLLPLQLFMAQHSNIISWLKTWNWIHVMSWQFSGPVRFVFIFGWHMHASMLIKTPFNILSRLVRDTLCCENHPPYILSPSTVVPNFSPFVWRDVHRVQVYTFNTLPYTLLHRDVRSFMCSSLPFCLSLSGSFMFPSNWRSMTKPRRNENDIDIANVSGNW